MTLARPVRAFGVRQEKLRNMTTRSSQELDDIRRRRLRFRAWHRGMREVDLIMGGFADFCTAQLSEADLDEFERLLEVPDPELLAWVTGETTPPADYDTPFLRRLCEFNHRGAEAR
jgi:antitoxin CptB